MDQGRLLESMKDLNVQDDLPATQEQGGDAILPTILEATGQKFSPYDLSSAPTIPSGLPPELWTLVQSAPARFQSQYFLEVNQNLLENPNLTASHLARAELSYQSFTDATFNPNATSPADLANVIKHLRPECRPQLPGHGIEGYELTWTVVRKLIPRNPKLDDSLMQTCHLYTSHEAITIVNPSGHAEKVAAERHLILYIPHVSTPSAIPFYHPKVRSLAILYTYLPNDCHPTSVIKTQGTLSIYYSLFPSHPLDTRLSRTALKLLEIIHKHSRGRQAGYKKRVHHDQIISQKRFQDTYAYLKGKYAKDLIEGWVEQTPAEKHVFEDLGIAAFLMEVWGDMYGGASPSSDKNPAELEREGTPGTTEGSDKGAATPPSRKHHAPKSFPGFVDIGCGNGLLVYILNAEGWFGWGFDARRRKTWDTFPAQYASQLHRLLLVPAILQPSSTSTTTLPPSSPTTHNGLFNKGTFIISNHADELTPWTPLLAHLSSCPFIAIPCCSHDLGGARFRAPVCSKYLARDPNEPVSDPDGRKKQKKPPSAYASLCSWVCGLTEEMGWVVEREVLRIPSTRNVAVVGRKRVGGEKEEEGEKGLAARMEVVKRAVEKEMGGHVTIEQVWRMWMRSGGELVKTGKNVDMDTHV